MIRQLFERAKCSQAAWQKEPLANRKEILTRFSSLVLTHHEKLAQELSQEMGKPIVQARAEIKSTCDRIAFFVQDVEKVMAPQIVSDEKAALTEMVTQEALGVIANISAWNYPYFVGANIFVPALLTGNVVLYKPSEFATRVGQSIAMLLHEAGIPRDVFIPVIGGPEAGSALLEQSIDGVFFTGSYETGKKIAATIGPRMIQLQMELGGKDPAYVCEDALVPHAASSLAEGAFYNTGQSCCAVERIYVHHQVAEQFVAHFLKEVQNFTVGDPLDEKTFIGPLTRPAQLEVLQAQIADAQSKGARVLCGGDILPRNGSYFAPTVVLDVNHSMSLMREESFGPIIGIQVVKNDEEALSLMQDTPYGLTAGVYTPSKERAEALLSQIDVGTVYWNCCDRVSPRLPWTGRKHSGTGVTLSAEGIRSFTRPKAWHLRAL